MNPSPTHSTTCPYCQGTSIPPGLVRAAIFSVLDLPYHTLARLDALQQKICQRNKQKKPGILDILQLALENGLDHMELVEQTFVSEHNKQSKAPF